MNEKVISIDIGGTKISLAVVQNNKIISDVIKVSTPDSAEGILQVILDNIELLLKEYNDIFAVACATAGAVNLENSKIIGSTGNLPEGYSNLDFSGEIKRKFNLNVFIENDANAAAYAEYKVGSARGYDNSITITLGTGIGGGIIVNGKLLRGKSGSAAEVGHIRLREEPKVACTCGHYDCWEAYASGTGYVKIAIEELLNFPPSKKSFLRNKDMCKINSYDVLEGVNNNDELCLKIHRRWEKLVLMGLISLCNVFDPDIIIIGGGMAEFIDMDYLEKELNQNLVVPSVKLALARAGNYAGILGAAILASSNSHTN